MTETTPPAADTPPVVDAPTTPPIPEPVWHEYTRTTTVQAYKIEGTERIITVSGLIDVGPDNYVVNDGGFISVIAAPDFEALYPVEEAPVKK